MAEVDLDALVNNVLASLQAVSGDVETVHTAGKWMGLINIGHINYQESPDVKHFERLQKTINYALEFLGGEATKWTSS